MIYKTNVTTINENGKPTVGNNTPRRVSFDTDTNSFTFSVISKKDKGIKTGIAYKMPDKPAEGYADYNQLVSFQTGLLVKIAMTGQWPDTKGKMCIGWHSAVSRGKNADAECKAIATAFKLTDVYKPNIGKRVIRQLHIEALQAKAKAKADAIAKGKATKLAKKLAKEAGLPVVTVKAKKSVKVVK